MVRSKLSFTIENKIGIVELNNPPHNFFDLDIMKELTIIFGELERDSRVRCIVFCASGKTFCAGADFTNKDVIKHLPSLKGINPLYEEAIRLFKCTKPIIAAVEGSAIGGGLGLALVADFRIACKEAIFSANFTRLGFHPGFALSYTLPKLIGYQHAARMFYTGERIDGEKALEIGLVDELVEKNDVLIRALNLAQDISISSPRAVQETRRTLLQNRIDSIYAAMLHESEIQATQMNSVDLKEGVLAATERRFPEFAD